MLRIKPKSLHTMACKALQSGPGISLLSFLPSLTHWNFPSHRSFLADLEHAKYNSLLGSSKYPCPCALYILFRLLHIFSLFFLHSIQISDQRYLLLAPYWKQNTTVPRYTLFTLFFFKHLKLRDIILCKFLPAYIVYCFPHKCRCFMKAKTISVLFTTNIPSTYNSTIE